VFSAAWKMVKGTVLAFIDDEALSRGAANRLLHAQHCEGRWGGPPQVVVTTDNGELRYVEQTAALAVLEAEMTAKNLTAIFRRPMRQEWIRSGDGTPA
jgi:hypothetical protein